MMENTILWPNIGARVKYTTMKAIRGSLEMTKGISTVVSITQTGSPHFTVADGQEIHPTLGDTWVVLEQK